MSRNSGSFFGSGPPPRQLILSVNFTRFPLTGDSWYDTDTGNQYIFNNTNWNLIPKEFNYNDMINIYNNNINAIVGVAAYTGDGINPITIQELNFSSGFFISTDGYIITTASVLYIINTTLPNGLPSLASVIYVRVFPENILTFASIIGIDRKADLALLKINLLDYSLSNRTYLTFYNSRLLQKGSPAILLGQSVRVPPSHFDSLLIDLGSIIENKLVSQTQHRESISITCAFPPSSYGCPILTPSQQVIGIASWTDDITNTTDPNLPYSTVKGAISSFLAEPIINTFLSLPTGTTGYMFPIGFFGITYDYYNAELYVTDGFTNDPNPIPQFITGIKLTADDQIILDNVSYVVSNDSILNSNGIYSLPSPSITPYPGSPAASIGLELGDIIISACRSGETLLPIGNTDDSVPFDTIVHLATNTGMIDIEYLKASEDWQIVNTLTNIGLTGIPNILNHPLNRFT